MNLAGEPQVGLAGASGFWPCCLTGPFLGAIIHPFNLVFCSALRLCDVTVLFELRPAAASHWTGNMLARQQLASRTTGRRAAVSNFIRSCVC
jgi:hypothetical protein